MDTISTPEALYKFLRDSGTLLVENMIFAGSPGHQILELDYFLRRFAAGDINKEKKYLWVQRLGDITATMASVYGPHFRQYHLGMVAHDEMYRLASQVARMVPELGVDVSLSHVKNSVMSREGTYVNRLGDDVYYFVTNDAVVEAKKKYYRLRQITEEFRPWHLAKPELGGDLVELLGGKVERYALVHFRERAGNAGTVIPPENLFPSLEFLKDNGYTLVKVGTEPYPDAFKRYDVINYTGSPHRNFKNDLALLSNSKLNFINGSGLGNLSDVMDIPVVDYGRWHLPIGPYSSKTVIVPALFYDPERQKLASFAEQILFFRSRPQAWETNFFGWHFPIYKYVARPPQADELRAALEEALILAQADHALTPLQTRFNQLDQNGLLSLMKSRISHAFLQRFEQLL